MLYVQHNLLAQNANRQLKASTDKNAKTTEKLSSGYRVNRAADDAAGLSISEKMRRQVRGLHQTVGNISEGVGYVQTAEGALNEVQDMLQRINELAVKAANGTNTNEDRLAIDQEIQQLKAEMNRIFSETTFNERKIWYPGDQKLLGYYKRQAAEFVSTSTSIAVTNDNCGVVAYGSYSITATAAEGVKISWTGYDGNGYSTVPISWDELKKNKYQFNMEDYFGNPDEPLDPNKPDGPKRALLYDANGNPVFRHRVAFAPQETATIQDIVDCIDGRSFYGSTGADMEARFENNSGAEVSPSAHIVSASLYYPAAYASNHNTGQDSSTSKNVHDFDKADDKFLEPVNNAGTLVQTLPSGGNLTKVPANGTSDVGIAKESTDKWEFSFYMDGIGMVKGTSSSISYCAPNDKANDDGPSNPTIDTYIPGLWWSWDTKWEKDKWVLDYNRPLANTISCSEKGSGSLGSFMQTLTGKKKTGSPGLLSSGNGGDADNGGYIDIGFSLTTADPNKPFEYGNGQKSTSVGSFTLRFYVTNTDTEQTVLNKVNGALNGNTILDFYTPTGNSTGYGYASFGTASANRHTIDVPIYGGICNFYVQAGTEGGQHIDIKYEALSTIALGMGDTNTRTIESASRAINEVKGALQIVSEQRSDFGAYQNRLEHAQNINANVEENTQSAESLIRDADIADTMMEYSINNILMQAGTSMLTQANQSNQSILELLQ